MAKKPKPDPVHRLVLTDRQFHTVVAALRCWQEVEYAKGRPEGFVCQLDTKALRYIASNAGGCEQLGCGEIEALIYSLQTS